MNVVIVAGGLGSRLAPLTNNVPKFLVNIGKNTGYVEQVKYWLQYCDFAVPDDLKDDLKDVQGLDPGSLTVIVHSAYADLISAYHKMYFPHVPLIVKTVDVANGSAHAILSTCDHLDGKAVFFQWCDVMPGCSIPANEMIEYYCGANVVFTNYDHPNRYGLTRTGVGWADVKPTLQEDGRGGIFGLYYVPHFHTSIVYQDGQDFVEVIDLYGKIREHKVQSIVDWGDKPKLERTRDTADHAREFNKVEFHGELVLKSALNEQGEQLIRREINWYNELLSRAALDEVPRPAHWPHPTGASFVMQRVHGVPVFEFWKTLDSENRGLVLDRIFVLMDSLHASVKIPGVYLNGDLGRDLKIEAYTKLLDRYDQIKDVITAFGPVTEVNGWKLKNSDPRETIKQLYEELCKHYDEETPYCLIHGDMQMSNTMINPDTMEVSIIDPRGYFGKSELFGLADYDIAKMLYSLSGYDLFNYSRDFHISTLKEGIIKFDIPRPELGGCDDSRFSRVHCLWLAVIWIGLGGYIRNDPIKAMCAHYHGLALAEHMLFGDRYTF